MKKKQSKKPTPETKDLTDLVTGKEKQLFSRCRLPSTQHKKDKTNDSDSDIEIKPETKNVYEVAERMSHLFMKNKINLKNAFDYPFIDINTFQSDVNEEDDLAWKTLSATLQNDYKLYGYRIDSTHDLATKMIGNLNRQRSGLPTEQPKEEGKKKKGKEEVGNKTQWDLEKFMEKNIGNITILLQSKLANNIPLFYEFCKQFSQTGLSSLLMGRASLTDEFELCLFKNLKKVPQEDKMVREKPPLSEKMVSQIQGIKFKGFLKKISMGRSKLYKNLFFELDEPQIDFEGIWNNIQNRKMKLAFENNDSSHEFDFDSDSEKNEDHEEQEEKKIQVIVKKEFEEVEEGKNQISEQEALCPISKLPHSKKKISQTIKINQPVERETQNEAISPPVSIQAQARTTRKKLFNDEFKRIIEQQRKSKVKATHKTTQQETLLFNPSIKESKKKIIKANREKKEDNKKWKEKNLKKERKGWFCSKDESLEFIKKQLFLSPQFDGIPFTYSMNKNRKQIAISDSSSNESSEEEMEDQPQITKMPSIRLVKERIGKIIREQRIREFDYIYETYMRKEGYIKKSLCYIALLHLANEQELQFKSLGSLNFEIGFI